MRPEDVVHCLLEADQDWDSVDREFGALDAQVSQRGQLVSKLDTAIQQKFPHRRDFQQRVSDLKAKHTEVHGLLDRARCSAQYRRALAKVGLKPVDVAQRFTGQTRLLPLKGRLRLSDYAITYVETKDGRRVKLDPPVQLPQVMLRKPVAEAFESGRRSKRSNLPPSRPQLPLKMVPLARPPIAPRSLKHFMDRVDEYVSDDEWKDFTDNMYALSAEDLGIMVPHTYWWMAFPYGHRVAGEGRYINTCINKTATVASIEVYNPKLTELHRTYWRGKSEFYQ